MKKTFIPLCFILCAILFLRCTLPQPVDENNTGEKNSSLDVIYTENGLPENGILNPSEKKYKVIIKANSQWSVDMPINDWLTFTKNADSVVFKALENLTGRERSLTVSIVLKELTQTLILKQPSVDNYFNVSQTPLSFSKETQSSTIEVISLPLDVEWEVVSSVDWITFSDKTGSQVTINLTTNSDADMREGIISFVKNGETLMPITVSQIGQFDIEEIQVAYFSFDSDHTSFVAPNINFDAIGSDVTFTIGRYGKAFSGDQSPNSYLSYNITPISELSAISEYAISFWVKDNGSSGFTPFINLFADNGDALWGNLMIGRENAAYKQITVTANATVKQWFSPNGFNFSDWTHVIANYNATTNKTNYFVNGVKLEEISNNGVIQATVVNSKIYFGSFGGKVEGKVSDGWANNAKILIDEVRFMNRGLTDIEATLLYNIENSRQ